MGVSVDRSSPATNRILFCTGEGNVYRGTNDGLAWSPVMSGNNCQYTEVDFTDAHYVYAGGDGGFFRSAGGGVNGSWTNAGLPEMTAVKAIRCDPSNRGWVYVACFGGGKAAKGLYRSKDRGATWQKLLSDYFLRDVALDPKHPNNLYAASSSNETWGWYDSRSRGFLYSRDGGATWKQANEGLSWPFAATIDVDAHDPSCVFLGSPGLGFQRRRFSD